MNKPEIFVISGPNGAGKSTTATVLLPESLQIDQFVNADLIANGLSPFSPASAALDAGHVMYSRIRKLRDQHRSFAFETTLASRSYVAFLRQAQDSGFIVHLAYIWLSSPDLAESRVAARVQQGGHDVPRETIVRRYWRGLSNFFERYQSLANTWTLCDNSSMDLVVVAQGTQGANPTILDAKRMATIRRQAGHAP